MLVLPSEQKLEGLQKGGFQKSGFRGWSWTPRTGMRVKKPVFLDPQNRNEGTKKKNDGTKNRNEATFAKNNLLQNRPFVSSQELRVGRGGGQAVFNQILTRFHGKTGQNQVKTWLKSVPNR